MKNQKGVSMSLLWVILGTIAQLMLAVFLFMVVAFSAGDIFNNDSLNKLQMTILNMSLFVLPGICILSAGMVIYYYIVGGSSTVYWWNIVPVISAALYLIYAISLKQSN